jgi:hypothetical protein
MNGREPNKADEFDAVRQMVELVGVDYDATQRALSGFVNSSGQLRAIGIGAWGVVFAVALQSESRVVAIIAALLAAGFAIIDGYHSALYRQTLRRARTLEEILGDYYISLGIGATNPQKALRARARLEQHRLGVHRSMQPVNQTSRWWLPRPLRVTWIYLALIILALGGAAYFQTESPSSCQNGHRGAEPCLLSTTTSAPPDHLGHLPAGR